MVSKVNLSLFGLILICTGVFAPLRKCFSLIFCKVRKVNLNLTVFFKYKIQEKNLTIKIFLFNNGRGILNIFNKKQGVPILNLNSGCLK